MMNQLPSQLSSNLPIQNNPFIKASLAPTVLPLEGTSVAAKKRQNPFLSAMNTESKEFKDSYGVNKPLPEAMFLGYRDDKPILAGSRLFILY